MSRNRARALAPLLVLLPALLAGCTAGPADGEGEYVAVVRNTTEAEANVVISVFHSSTKLIPSEGDPAINGELRIAPGASGAFLFSLPEDTRALTVQLGSYRRLFTPSQVEACPVLVFKAEPRAYLYEGCGPAPPTGNEASS